METTNPTTTTAPVTAAPAVASSAPVAAAPVTAAKPATAAPASTSAYGARAPRPGRGGFDKNRTGGPKRSARPEKVKSEYDQRILNIRRVTRVVAGGRRFAFSVAIVIGNHKGSVGVGTGKAGDTSLAIDKAVKNAKKSLIKIMTTKDMSIPHEVSAKYASARVVIRPAKGRGLIAGSAARDLLELAGVNDINAKIVSPSKNKLNIARGTIKALMQLKAPRAPKVAAVAAPSAVAAK
jgi:small subunit ribosomal protein S5